jgi:hypothetical protein
MSGFRPNQPIHPTYQVQATASYECDDVDITQFSFNPDGDVSFTVRFNGGGENTQKQIVNITGQDFIEYALNNIQAIKEVRAGCFKYLVDKGIIPSGVDTWGT